MRRPLTVVVSASMLHSVYGAAQTAPPPDDGIDSKALEALSELSIEELMDATVEVSTDSPLSVSEAPATVTVITASQLHVRGCRTVACALRGVPGFYDAYNLVSHNFGVRGINGGLGAAGSVVKLMIDHQPVSYAPTTGNFFGLELIPIDAVERIEILRGPASALYGADAFLGVIDVITKRNAQPMGMTATVGGGVVRRNPGGEASIVATASAPDVADILIGIAGGHVERSGLGMPASSPLRERDLAAVADTLSRDDHARPRSLFARASVGKRTGWGELTGGLSHQQLNMDAEFDDIVPLTHQSRVMRRNDTLWLQYDREFRRPVDVSLGVLRTSASADGDILSVGDERFVLNRIERARGYRIKGSLTFRLARLETKIGADFSATRYLPLHYEEELLQDQRGGMIDVLRVRGTRTPISDSAEVTLKNLGAFVQLHYASVRLLSLTLGARLDHHSLYGNVVSPRAAVVHAPAGKHYYLKLGYASSFKAPSVEQLYAEATPQLGSTSGARGRIGTVVFADRSAFPTQRVLKPQRAHSVELSGGASIGGRVFVTATAYMTRIVDLARYEPAGTFLLARNVGTQHVVGGELELNVAGGRYFDGWVGGSVARTVAVGRHADSTLEEQRVYDIAFPWISGMARASVHLPVVRLSVTPELSVIGPRKSSQTNADLAGGPYTLPAYVLLGLAIYGVWAPWSGHPLSATLRVDNLLNRRYVDPGWYGFDVPALGTCAFAYVSQQF